MPNHIHGIIRIIRPVGYSRDCTLQGLKIKPLPELVGAYKMTTSKIVHQQGIKEFKWQKSYYDHIILDKYSIFKIRNYINSNPSKWHEDKFYNVGGHKL